MAFYDWNHDGEKNLIDDYLEYNIYKESTKNSGSSGGFLSRWFIGFVVICIFLYIFGACYEPVEPCMAIGCLEDRTEYSIFCAKHSREYD